VTYGKRILEWATISREEISSGGTMRNLLLFAAALTAAACATPKVEAGNPRPNVDLPRSARTLRLQLEPEVRDAFSTELSGVAIPVSGWRSTLETGFRNAFSGAFTLSAKPADLTVLVAEAELSFNATSFARNGRPISAEAQVRYKARLLDPQGGVVRRSAATVASKKSASAPDEATPVAAGAVESMYENIARELFEEKSAR
jgi:hypothetical protein